MTLHCLKKMTLHCLPVSVLSLFSKILEKIMYKRIVTYIETNNILYDKQFGFREGHSTSHALTVLCNKLYEALDKGHYALGIVGEIGHF